MKTFFLCLVLIGTSCAQTTKFGGHVSRGGNTSVPISISGLTASPDANTVVLQWTTNLASNSTGSCGGEQAADNGVQTAVTSHEVVIAGLSPSTGYTCTAGSASTTQNVSATTTAQASSTPITGVTIGSVTAYNSTSPPAANGGDTFYNAVSNDGTTYVVTDDTTFGWTGQATVNTAMMVGKFTNLSPIVGANVNTLTGFGTTSSGPSGSGLSSKLSGLFPMGGCLLGAMGYQNENDGTHNRQYYGGIIESCDHGATWTNLQGTNSSAGTIPSPYTTTSWPQTTPTSFASPAWVMMAADDGTNGYLVSTNRVLNANAFVYVISNGQTSGGNACWTGCDKYFLARTPRASMLANPGTTVWQFYTGTGGDGTQDAAWSTSQSAATAILTNTGDLSLASMQYFPALNRWLLLTWYYPGAYGDTTTWEAYDCSAPWSCSSVAVTSQPTGHGFYNPVPLQADALAASSGTTTARILFSGYWAESLYNLQFATMTVSH